MGWDDVDAAVAAGGGGVYLRLKDGEKAVVAFVGEPQDFKQVWADGTSELFDPALHAEADADTRVAFNVYDVGALEMRIFEANPPTYNQIKKMRSKYGLDGKTFEIERTGSQLLTRYTVLPDADIDATVRTGIKASTLHDLVAKYPSNEAPARTSTRPDAAVDMPASPLNDPDIPF